MAGLKEIKARIKSVKNTKKITYAMKLVSATKMRSAQDAVLKSRSYSDALKSLLGSVIAATGASELNHPLLEERKEIKKVKLLVIGANKGLCGSYNSNVNKAIAAFYEQHQDKEIEAVIIGRKVQENFKRRSLKISESHVELNDNPHSWPLDEICKNLTVEFERGAIDAAYIIYTRFKSALSTTIKTEQLLPVDPANLLADMEEKEITSQVLFEPSAEEVFGALLPRMLRITVGQGALDSKASEFGSRMTAMDAATKNAGELIDKLTLTHNKLRQAGITAQILEIVGGANALEK